jgi:hypothetical protein
MSIVSGDDRWRIEGGLAGHVKYADGTRAAEMEFEMLMGDSALVIYGERCRWTVPEIRKMTRDEVRSLVAELARAMRARVDLTFPEGDETIG